MSSSTKIEIEYPYSTKYKSAYLVVNKDNRRTVILYNSHSDRSSTQYARYLMAVKLGRFLEEHEHIDHKDDDKTNDHIDNLQILTLAQNNIKTHKKPNVELICPNCHNIFERTRTQLRGRTHLIQTGLICCSKKCGGQYGHKRK